MKTKWLSLVATMLILSGCGRQVTFPVPRPLPTAAPDALPGPVPFEMIPDSVISSTAPLSPLPTPGQMPAGSYMRTIQDSGKLIAGVRSDLLLFGFVDPITQQWDGFDVAMVRAIAKAIGVPVELHPVLSAQRIPFLQSGQVQIVAAVMTVNAPRKQVVDFSELYFRAAQRVLVGSDNPATGIQDLGDQRVCIAAGSTSISNALGANPAIQTHLVVRDSESDCASDLQLRLVDAVTSDDAILATFVPQVGSVKVVGNAFSDEPYGLAMQKGHPEFVAFVNGVLSQMKQNGEWKADYEKYLATALSPGKPTPEPPPSIYDGR